MDAKWYLILTVILGLLLKLQGSKKRSETPSIPVAVPKWADEKPRTAPKSEVEKQAQRLAHLLVVEIAMYNEEKIEAGRKKGQLWSFLKEDIERSHKIYLERVDPSVDADFFIQELVERLAGGDVKLFGLK